MSYLLLLIPFLIVLVVAAWFVLRNLDEFRIREQIESRGGKLIGQRRTASENDGGQLPLHVYEVRYRDADGHEHRATVRTGIFRPVTWGEDQIIQPAEQGKGPHVP